MTEEKYIYARHFILYSKYHYKITDTWEDLKKIYMDYCMVEEKYVQPKRIFELLNELVFEYYINEEGISWEQRYFDVSYALLESEGDFKKALKRLLSFLGMTLASNFPEIGEPDSKILPLK